MRWIGSDGALVAFPRFGDATGGEMEISQIVQRIDVLGIEREEIAIACFGVGEPTLEFELARLLVELRNGFGHRNLRLL